MALQVSVIVPHYRDDHLEKTIQCLVEQDFEHDFEIVVIDDNSGKDFEERLMRIEEFYDQSFYPLLRCLLNGERVGCGESRNRAVATSTAQIIAFCDSDLEPNNQWLQEGYNHVGLARVVTGPVPKRFGNKRPSLAERYNSLETPHHAGLNTYGTGNLMLTRDDFYRVGGFNKDLKRGHDLDFFTRWKGDVKVISGMTASHPAKTHKMKVRTIKEIVNDWKKLGHRPNFARRVVPDRNLLKVIRESDYPKRTKNAMIVYHFILKAHYLYYWMVS